MITDNIQKGGGSGGSSIPLPVSVPNGGTGATDAATARSNLGLGSLATKNSISSSEVSGLGTAATKDYTTSVSSDSSDLITSGAVYAALSNKMDIPSGSVGSANQVMYLNNGVFTAGNTLPSSVTVTTSMTSSSTSYAAAASLVYNRFVRAIAPIETGSTASSARAIGDLFIDSSGYLRRATSAISSGTSYSSKSSTTTLAGLLSTKTAPIDITSSFTKEITFYDFKATLTNDEVEIYAEIVGDYVAISSNTLKSIFVVPSTYRPKHRIGIPVVVSDANTGAIYGYGFCQLASDNGTAKTIVNTAVGNGTFIMIHFIYDI